MCSLISDFNNVLQASKENVSVIYWKDHDVRTLSYQQVKKLSDHITDAIKQVIEENTCIGLYMEHNYLIPSLIISLHNCNLAFIVLDPYDTLDYNINLVQTLKIKWVISQSEEDKFLKEYATETKLFKFDLLRLWSFSSGAETDNSYMNCCYAICTSGTTKNPKIVKVEHFCIMKNIDSLRKRFKLTPEDVIYFGSPLTFDPSMVELYLAVTTGAALLMPPTKLKMNPQKLLKIMFPNAPCIYKGVTVLQMVPSLFLRWTQAEIQFILKHSTCRILAFGGEKFPDTILSLKQSLELSIFNLYGITELSCWAFIYEVINPAKEVLLGEPLDDTIFEVRSEDNIQITCGEGEMYIGSYNRLCHVDQEDLNNLEKPIFRSTGDIVRLYNNKEIVYVGRKNYFVKRFGQKVNLLEIEEIVFKNTNILNYCMFSDQFSKLILYLRIKEFNHITKQKILDKVRVKLLHILPKHYLPDHIEIIHSFPLTSHGKIDLKSLEKIYNNVIEDVEKSIHDPQDTFICLLCKYTGLSNGNAEKYLDHNFMEVGGNSISAIQMLSEFQHLTKTKDDLNLTTMLLEKTLKDCINYVSSIKIQNLKRKELSMEDISCTKIQMIENIDNGIDHIRLEISWKVNLGACVDAPASIIKNENQFMVAVGSFSHIFTVVDSTSGNIVTKTVLPDSIESAGLVSSKYTHIYVGCHDGNMYCLDYTTGIIHWKYSTCDIIKCTPCFCLNEEAIAFGSYDKYIHCISIKNGNLFWKTMLQGSVTSNPIYHNNNIYIATILGTCACLNEKQGEILWKYQIKAPIFGSPCIFKDNLIVWPAVNGTIHCFLSSNGEEVWKFNAKDKIFSSVLWYDNHIIFGCHDHKVYCLEHNHHNCYTLKYTTLLDSAINSKASVMLHNGSVHIIIASNNGFIYLIDFHNGKIVKRLQFPNQIFSSPLIKGRSIYFGCRDNYLYCVNIKINK